MSRGGGRCCWNRGQGGLRCCSGPLVHRTGCDKELSGPKRQVFCVCFFGGCAGSSLLRGHFSTCEQGLLSSFRARASHCSGSSGGAQLWLLRLQSSQLLGSRAQWLWCAGSVVPRHVGPSRIRDKLESPASAGGFFTIELPQKHCLYIYIYFFFLPHQGACGILVPRPEIEPVPLAVESRSADHHTARKAPLGQVLISELQFPHLENVIVLSPEVRDEV